MAWALIVIGAAVRCYYASASYLNPDEAMHYSAAAAPDWLGALRASRHQAHPPLLVLITHAWLPFATSEGLLRAPSVVAGVLSLWLLYRWLFVAAGSAAALAGLMFLTVSPAMISAATEVRHTAWLILFIAAALLAAEHFATRHRVGDAARLSAALCAAMLSHYGAALIVAAAALYLPWRLLLSRARLRAWLMWALLQIPVAMVGYWALFVHGSRWAPKLAAAVPKHVPTSGAARFSYLAPALHQPEKESAAAFVVRGLYDVWLYLCGSHVTATLTLIVLGIAAARAWKSGGWRCLCWPFLMIVVLPLVIGGVAGVLRLYPFGPSRHVAFLLPFAAAAIGIASAQLLQQRAWWVGGVAVVAVPLWLWSTVPANDPARMARPYMTAALAYLDSRPRDALLLVDFQTQQILEYYWRRRLHRGERIGRELVMLSYEGQRVVGTHYGIWEMNDSNGAALLGKVLQASGARPGQELWAVSTAWPHQRRVTRLPVNLTGTTREFGQAWVLRTQVQDTPIDKR